jgi:hypothetical protein
VAAAVNAVVPTRAVRQAIPIVRPALADAVHLNLKTAKVLGITIAPALLSAADEVIE